MIKIIALVCVLICAPLYAADVPASEASIREMLTVTDVRKLLDSMIPQIQGMMKNSMQQALGGRELTADQQKMADKVSEKTTALIKTELSWEKLEPMYIAIYQKSLTQEEVDGMLAFYKTPAGAAMIKKMPVVVQNTMTAMQARMGPMMQEIQKMAKDTVAEIEAEKSTKE